MLHGPASPKGILSSDRDRNLADADADADVDADAISNNARNSDEALKNIFQCNPREGFLLWGSWITMKCPRNRDRSSIQ